MGRRLTTIGTCAFAIVLATTDDAKAADPPPRWLLWKPVPPVRTDPSAKGGSFIVDARRFFGAFRGPSLAMSARGADMLGRDAAAAAASTSLGVARPRGPSAVGAMLVGVGASGGAAWISVNRGRATPPIAVGPRLHQGGGGLAFTVRF